MMDMMIRTRADGKLCLEGDLWPGEAEEGDRFCIEADDLTIYANGGTRPLVKFSPGVPGSGVLCTRYVGGSAVRRRFPIVWVQDGRVEKEQLAEDDVAPAGIDGALMEGDVAVDPTTGETTVAEPEEQEEPHRHIRVQGPQVVKPAAIEGPAPAPGGDVGGSG